ncbi:MAG: hypothetical protein IJV69_05730 [Kiritimatiellae bacterium]|nr:hypothetical protein [Kiritimatiellia bacterium]
MKRLQDFVSKGSPEVVTLPEGEASVDTFPLSSRLHPADLPRDYGMAGRVGAYEVKPLTQFVDSALQTVEAWSATCGDGLAEVSAILDRLMRPEERHRLAVEQVVGNTIILSLARKQDRFYYNRAVVPKLTAALRSKFGAMRVQLVDRLG